VPGVVSLLACLIIIVVATRPEHLSLVGSSARGS
jgi:hypothetical protein